MLVHTVHNYVGCAKRKANITVSSTLTCTRPRGGFPPHSGFFVITIKVINFSSLNFEKLSIAPMRTFAQNVIVESWNLSLKKFFGDLWQYSPDRERPIYSCNSRFKFVKYLYFLSLYWMVFEISGDGFRLPPWMSVFV